MPFSRLRKKREGSLALEVIILGGVAIIVGSGFILWAASFLNLSLRNFHNAQAFSIAEAGLEYYRWHLAHVPGDYQDGQGVPGPYLHTYYDKNGVAIGSFELAITPPPSGSTMVAIQSTGRVVGDATVEKTISVRLGIPSFAKYAFVTRSFMRFGEGTEVFGEILSNGGVRFDGHAHNLVRSAATSTDDEDHTGANEHAVHTHVNVPPATGVNDNFRPLEAPPNPLAARPDIFYAGRQLGVPAVDFDGMTQDLAEIRAAASSSGVYFGTSTTGLGYELVLNTTSSYAVYRVTALVPAPSGCTNSNNQAGWGTWSVQSRVLQASGPIPTNGLFFFEENVWVRGQVDGARVTVAAGRLPNFSTTTPAITVNNDLRYTHYDGSDVIQLISQTNVNVGMVSEDDLRIDAALIAQIGRVGRYYYRPATWGNNRCAPYDVRAVITSYGMIGTSLRYGFAYTGSANTGYVTRNLIYDTNLLYRPPPAAPQTTDQYTQVFWEETR